MPAHEPCKHDGCTQGRTRHSVFCEEHHRQQLIRAGLLPAPTPKPPPPHLEHVKKCSRVLKTHQQGLITTDELHAQLADILVHVALRGQSELWPQCLDSLPPPVRPGLLAYLRTATRPHGFFLTSDERVQAASAAQIQLAAALQARLRQ